MHALSESLGMCDLSAQCEHAMVMHWENKNMTPCLTDQLSKGALYRIASGLSWVKCKYSDKLAKDSITFEPEYPDIGEFMEWKPAK